MNTVSLNSDLASFIASHQIYGIWYKPLMVSFLAISLYSPVWIAYLIILIFVSFITLIVKNISHSFKRPKIAKKAKVVLEYVQLMQFSVRIILDGILNPVAMPIYVISCNYLFKNSSILKSIYYTNQLGIQSLYPNPFFITTTIIYLIWTYIVIKTLKKYKPFCQYEKHIITPFFSPSRIFGSAVMYITYFDFVRTIDDILWASIYFGSFISIVCFTYRVIKIYNSDDLPYKYKG